MQCICKQLLFNVLLVDYNQGPPDRFAKLRQFIHPKNTCGKMHINQYFVSCIVKGKKVTGRRNTIVYCLKVKAASCPHKIKIKNVNKKKNLWD